MWTTFPVILLFFSFLAAALQSRAENDNFTQDVLYGTQTTLVARDPQTQGKFKSWLNGINPFRPSPNPSGLPVPPAQAEPQHDVVIVPLTKKGHYRLASIEIHAQQRDVVVHTDSPCFWIMYDPSQSMSDKGKRAARGKTCDSRLHDRPTVSGDVYLDQISVGEMEEDGMVLSVKGTSGMYDGEMGLALPTNMRAKEMMFVPDFISKRFPEVIFALHLTSSGGELHIGGPLKQYYEEDSMEYHEVTKALQFLPFQRWQIGPAVIGINGDEMVLSEKKIKMVSKKTEEVVSQKIETVFDSTLPFIYGSPKQVKKIYEAIRGSEAGPVRKGYEYTYPCKKQVQVHFRWGNGQPWILGSRRFHSRKISAEICEGIIRGELRVDGSPWVLGFPFMESLYPVFYWTPNYARMGLARLALPHYDDVPPAGGPPHYDDVPPASPSHTE